MPVSRAAIRGGRRRRSAVWQADPGVDRRFRGMIERLREASRHAVSVMETGRGRGTGYGAARRRTRQSLEIIENIATISATSGSIAAAVVEQSRSVDDINQTMVTISEVAEQTNLGAQELSHRLRNSVRYRHTCSS